MKRLLLLSLAGLLSGSAWGQQCGQLALNPDTDQMDCVGISTAPNIKAINAGPVTSLAVNITGLRLTAATLNTLIVQCWSGAGFDSNGPTGALTPITITSVNPRSTTSATANFSSASNVVCVANNNGGAAGVAGAPGANGVNGTNGTNGNTVLSGAGAPSGGSDGDFWLRTSNSCLYGPKASGSWPGSCTSLIGANGAAGANGTSILTGAGAPSGGGNGDFWIDSTAHCLYGPKASGTWPGSCVSMQNGGSSTASSGLSMPELLANGSDTFTMYSENSQSASKCITFKGTGSITTGSGKAWVSDGTTSTMTNGDVCTNMTWQTPGGAGGGLTIDTAGVGGNCIPYPCSSYAGGPAVPTKATPVYFQFEQPIASRKISTLAFYGGGGGAAHLAVAFYDSSCNKLTNGDMTTVDTPGGGGGFSSPMTSALTLPPGVYYVGLVQDTAETATLGVFQDGGVANALLNIETTKRFFTGATSATGTGASLAMPASCGAKTAYAANSPYIVAVLP